MTAAGAYRLGLYCLFSGHPLAAFAREGALRVLVSSDDPMWETAFRAVFWAGQSDEAALRITVAGVQAEAARARLFSDAYPALAELLEKGYAELTFTETPAADYDVVLSPAHLPLLRPEGLFAVPGSEEDAMLPELMRLARNIDFSFAMAYDQRRSEAAQHAEFDAAFETEFGPDPGESYNADSSIAAAAFFSSHLDVCGSVDALSEAIRARDLRWCRMMALEHRRWVAYMAMRGYRAHRRELGEWDYIYDGKHNHKHTGLKLHMGMCESGRNGLNAAMRTAAFWSEAEPPADTAELDRASWICHRIACRKAGAIRLDDLRCRAEFQFLNDPAYDGLVHAIEALLRDEPNALAVYRAALRTARASAAAAMEAPAFDALDRALQIAKVRAQRVNFFSLDAQMVDMIPFCLWHGKRWGTVLTFTDGVAVEDVVIPTLLCAGEAIFAGDAAGNADYQAAVSRYFAARGANTRVRFVSCAPETADMTSLLHGIIASLPNGERGLVLNLSRSRRTAPDAAVALGMALARFPGLAAVRYDPVQGVVAFDSEGAQLSAGLCSKSFSVEECIALMGAAARPDGMRPLSGAESAALSELFWRCQRDAQSAKALRAFSEFLRRGRSETFPVKAPRAAETVALHIPHEIFSACALGSLLQSLQSSRIVRALQLSAAGGTVLVSFESVDPQLAEWLRPFEGPDTPDYRLSFRPGGREGVLRRVPLRVQKTLLPEERKSVPPTAQTLASAGLISETQTDGETLAFSFFNPDVAELLTDPGRMFEREVFAAVRDSGEFDDVQTGVHLRWDDRPAPAAPDGADFGYAAYDARRQTARSGGSTENELDVIAVRGMTALFLSCKTNRELTRSFVYEIDAVSAHFRALGALCVPRPLSEVPEAVIRRVKSQGVSLLTGDALCAPAAERIALLHRLAAGETVIE